MIQKTKFALILCLTVFLVLCNGDRTKDKMYDVIHGGLACFRRMNGTHQIGCSSKRGGSTGVVHVVENKLDINFVLSLNNSLKYVFIIPINYFKKDIPHQLKLSPEIVSGVVLTATNETIEPSYSHEAVCPNDGFNLNGTCNNKWNHEGTGLLLEEFPFPIFYVRDAEEIIKINKCFNKFNNFSFETQATRSLCSLELDAFMFAAKDTPTCIRRSNSNINLNPVKFCDPLGDQNVWASLFPVGNSKINPSAFIKPDMRYIVLAARLDSTSLFHELVPGADNPITGLVSLLSTAELLKRMLPEYKNDYKQNVIFMLINGESYDYIGSQRIVYDMENDQYPTTSFTIDGESVTNIKLEDISLFLEISQLGSKDDLHVHTLDDSEVRNFINLLNKYSSKKLIENNNMLPPSSLQTFKKSNPNIPGLVLADHGNIYNNMFYNSIFDDKERIGFTYINESSEDIFELPQESIQGYVFNLTGVLAKSLFEEITKNAYAGQEIANGQLINELFHCYLENANCTVHQAIQKKPFKPTPLSFYVGVTVAPNILTSLIGLTLAWFTGDKVDDSNCKNHTTSYIYKYFNMSESINNLNSTKCFQTVMNFTDAESPAFIIDDYDWSSGNYSTWSESVWRDFSMRLYLKPSRAHEIITLSIGSVTFAVAILIIYFINNKSDKLFEINSVSPVNC